MVQQGLLEMQTPFYEGWSGRFSFTPAVGLVELIGAWVVPVLPVLALVGWVAVLT